VGKVITVEEVQGAYNYLGMTPVVGGERNTYKCCAMWALFIRYQCHLDRQFDGIACNQLKERDMLRWGERTYGEEYFCGFIVGFDGKHHKPLQDTDRAWLGFHHGKAAADVLQPEQPPKEWEVQWVSQS